MTETDEEAVDVKVASEADGGLGEVEDYGDVRVRVVGGDGREGVDDAVEVVGREVGGIHSDPSLCIIMKKIMVSLKVTASVVVPSAEGASE